MKGKQKAIKYENDPKKANKSNTKLQNTQTTPLHEINLTNHQGVRGRCATQCTGGGCMHTVVRAAKQRRGNVCSALEAVQAAHVWDTSKRHHGPLSSPAIDRGNSTHTTRNDSVSVKRNNCIVLQTLACMPSSQRTRVEQC